MKDTVELRLKPELKIIFKTEGFELIDAAAPKNTGVYLYKNLIDVKLNPEGRSWFVLAVTLIIELFITESFTSGKEKNKASLQLKMATKNIKIWLIDVDFREAERVVQLLNKYLKNN